MRRFGKKILPGVLAVLVVVLLAVPGWLLGTRSGARMVLSQLSATVVPGLAFDGLRGCVWKGLRFSRLSYRSDTLEVALEEAAFTWSPIALGERTLEIETLTAERVTVELATGADMASSVESKTLVPAFALPTLGWEVRAQDLSVQTLEVVRDRVRQRVEGLRLKLVYGREQATLERLAGRYLVADTSTPTPTPTAQSQSQGQSQVTSVTFDLSASVPLETPVTHAFSLKGEANITGLSEPTKATFNIAADKRGIPLELNLSGAARLASSLRVDGLASTNGAIRPQAFREWVFTGHLTHGPLPTALTGLSDRIESGALKVSGPLTRMAIEYAGGVDLESGSTPVALSLQSHLVDPETVEAEVSLAKAGPLSGLQGRLRVHQREAWLDLSLVLPPPLALEINAEVERHSNDPAIRGNLAAYDWPTYAFDGVEFALDSLRANVEGTMSEPILKTEIKARTAPVGSLDIVAQAMRTTPTTVVLQAFDAKLLAGEVSASGTVELGDVPGFAGALTVSQIDPARFKRTARTLAEYATLAPELPSAEVSVQSNVDLDKAADGLRGNVHMQHISGRWQRRPVRGQGELILEGSAFTIPTLSLGIGQNTLAATAKFDGEIDATAEVSVVDFADLMPEWKGALSGTLALQGSASAPRVRARLDGKDIELSGISTRQLAGDINIDFTPENATQAESKGTLTLADVQLGNVVFASLEIGVRGRREAHVLALAATPAPTARGQAAATPQPSQGPAATSNAGLDLTPGVRLALEGGLAEDNAWQGTVTDLALTPTPLGPWTLVAPAPLALDPEQGAVTAGRLCLKQAAARACVTTDALHASAGRLEVDLTAFALSSFDRWVTPALPDDLSFDGVVDGRVRVHRALDDAGARHRANLPVQEAEHRWLGDASVSLRNVEIAVAGYRENQVTEVRIQDTTLHGALSEQSVTLQGHVAVLPLMTLGLDAMLPRDPQNDFALHADAPLGLKLDIAVPDLTQIANLDPLFNGAEGSLNLHIEGEGTLQDPRVEGRLSSENMRLPVAQLGISLADPRLTLSTDRDLLLKLEGALDSSAGGTLHVAGVVPLDALMVNQAVPDKTDDDTWPLALELTGDAIGILRRGDLDVDLTPEIAVRGDLQGALEVTGTLHIPTLSLMLETLPQSTVTVSRDQVLVNAQGEPLPKSEDEQAASLSGVRAAVAVSLGDAVRISAFGLNTRISGGLEVKRSANEDELALASGRISMHDGKFEAYGQPLSITSGEFLFAGPIDNPSLSVRAVRPDIPITAGVNVSGTVNQPRVTLFSSPTQSEADTLSYILTGGALSSASSGEASMLMKAAQSFGLEQANGISSKIASAFALDQLTVSSDFEDSGALESSSLVMGKQLTKDISLRSELDLFTHLWSFFINYQLNENWALEAESGSRKSAGVVFTTERERLFDFRWPWQRAAPAD